MVFCSKYILQLIDKSCLLFTKLL